MRYREYVFACAVALASSAQAQQTGDPAERRYPLADRGSLILSVPAGWNERVGQRDAVTPPTIAYRPKSGQPFELRVTPIWPMKEGMTMPTPEQMRRSVQSAADNARAQAVEKAIAPVELKGPSAQGYYFKATDRAPKAGEFKYMTQGMFALGEIRVTFTILTNDGQAAVADAALEMLRNARLEPPKQASRPSSSGTAPPSPDKDKLQALLRAGDYAQLDAELSTYQTAYRNGAINDETAAAAFIALVDYDPDTRASYDAWVAALPQSYVARVARGYYLMRMGYLARGGEYAHKTPKARVDEMRAHFKVAMEDLQLSLKLDPRPTLSYGTMIAISRGVGTREDINRYIDAALALDPRVYTARAAYFSSLQPEWGGSHRQMQAALDAWKRSLEESQWRQLHATFMDSQWRDKLAPFAQMVDRGQYQQAIEGYSKVLEQTQGPVLRARTMRGVAYAGLGQYEKALADFDYVLEIAPDGGCCTGTRSNRADALLKMGKREKALEDLRIAAAYGDAWANLELGRIYAFGQHGFKPDYVAARKYCERGARQGDGMSMYCVGGLYLAGLGVPKDLPLAAYWFAAAGLRGIADAQADVGIMYWEGQGVPRDRERAAQWWRMAAAKGNARAANRLWSHGYLWSYLRYGVLASRQAGN